MIALICPGCKTRLTVGDDRAGQTFGCPRCGAALTVPLLVPARPVPPRPRPVPGVGSAGSSDTWVGSPAGDADGGGRSPRRWRGALAGAGAAVALTVLAIVFVMPWVSGRGRPGAQPGQETEERFGIPVPSEKSRIEGRIKQEIEGRYGIPVERVELVPFDRRKAALDEEELLDLGIRPADIKECYGGVAIAKTGRNIRVFVLLMWNGHFRAEFREI